MSLKIRLLTVIVFASVLSATPLLSSTVYAITNGQPDGNAHPYVCLVVFDVWNGTHYVPAWRCTGTLLSPTVVLVAGHCTDGAARARVWIGEIVQGNPEYPYGGATSYEGMPHTYPGYSTGGKGLPGFISNDLGLVILTEPVSGLSTYGTLPDVGEVDELPMMSTVDLVGYGVQSLVVGGGPPRWTGVRNRYNATAQLVTGNFVHSDEFVRLTANLAKGKGGTSFGDSGGPVLKHGTNVVLAVNSYVTNYESAGVTYSCRIDTADVLAWIDGFLSP